MDSATSNNINLSINTSDWLEIESKFNAKCKVCNEEIQSGEKCLWKRGEGVKHVEPCITEMKEVDVVVEEDGITEWIDPKTYSLKECEKIKNCQRCGKKLYGIDVYINCDRRTCVGCFSR